MFCFQCEQTAGCTGCTKSAGVCGKKADTAELQDRLNGALMKMTMICKSSGQPMKISAVSNP